MKQFLSILLLTVLACLPVRVAALDGFVGDTWQDHYSADGFGGGNFGNGTQSNPYRIRDAATLAYLAYMVNEEGETYQGNYFVIDADINLENPGTTRVWVPIGLNEERSFKGTLTNGTDANGNPYVISGMTIRANGTATTKCFGLFGLLQGTVEGLVIKNSNINISTDDEYYAGILCGMLSSDESASNLGTVRRCTAEGSQVACTSASRLTCIGGLIGLVVECQEVRSNLAKTTMMRLTGPVNAGGVFGEVSANKALTDCHAVVAMTIRNETDSEASVGGITGYCFGPFERAELLACTASGDIEVSGDGSKVVMGGITGHANYVQKLSYCTTSVSLSGGHTMGGLIGLYDNMQNATSAGIHQCFCASFVDAKKATYAGGLFGHLSFFRTYSGNYSVGIIATQTFTTFVGTMTKPDDLAARYGIIVGFVENDQQPDNFGYFRYDSQMCNLQLNGMGWNSNRWSTSSDYRLINTFESPKPQDGVYAYYQEAWMAELYLHLNGDQPFFTANMKVACAPFIVTSDYKTYFNAYDVTIDFLVEKFLNRTTGEELATFQLASPAPSCVKLIDNKVKLFDPGEATVIVNCRGLQRKVHLDITYGIPWDGTRSDLNFPGSGTAKDPYVIRKPEELCRVAYSAGAGDNSLYNNTGIHYILANDLFINTHLLKDDDQPRDDARNWTPRDWRAILHGNGKTIYGLKSVWTASEDGVRSGLFDRVSGTIEDLAVVDAYVQAAGSGSGICAGIICAELQENGTIERCLVHGTVQSNGFAGGICGKAESEGTRIADCFAAVHIGWQSIDENYIGAGIVVTTPEELTRCVSTCKVEAHASEYGITRDENSFTDCWFDRQMMSVDLSSPGSTFTKNMLSDKILSAAGNWRTEENRYPMLRQFAGTAYGELLAVPVLFAEGDYAGNVTQIFDLPTENVNWYALHGDTHIDVINECGAATPNGRTTAFPEHLVAQTASLQSECTRAKHSFSLDVKADRAGILFKDNNTEMACLAAFDADSDGLITLREAFTADAQKFAVFNANANAHNAESFTEMRYFAGITELQEHMLSGLSSLNELQLPKVLTTIGPNAFSGCTSLTEVTLPHTFTTANGQSFFGSGIRNIYVNEKNLRCTSIDGVLYKADDISDTNVMLMAYPPGRGKESATISAPLSKILSKAFYRVPVLSNIYIDNCLPEGEMAELSEPEDEEWSCSDAIIHFDDDDDTEDPQMHIYINDGSFNSKLFVDYRNDYDWGLYDDCNRLDIYYPLTVTSALWATLYIDFDTELPEGLEAYIASEPDTLNNIVELNRIGRLVPRSTPVAIKATEPGVYQLYKYASALNPIPKHTNRFIGSFIGQDDQFGVPVNQETAAEGNVLTLGRNKNGQIGFFKFSGQEIPPYRAYLTRNNIIEGPTALMVKIGPDIPTGIASADMQPQQTTGCYTIDGQKLSGLPTQRGLYIVNGKKVAVK